MLVIYNQILIAQLVMDLIYRYLPDLIGMDLGNLVMVEAKPKRIVEIILVTQLKFQHPKINRYRCKTTTSNGKLVEPIREDKEIR
mgnify:CR=1 FL=1